LIHDTVTDVAGRLRIGKDACSNLQPGSKPLKEVQCERNSEFCCLQPLATWQLQVTYIVMTIVNASDCCTMPEPSFEDAVSCFELYGCVQAAVVHANVMHGTMVSVIRPGFDGVADCSGYVKMYVSHFPCISCVAASELSFHQTDALVTHVILTKDG